MAICASTAEIDMTQDEDFKKWWFNEGSQPPYTHHDCEEHTMRMCEIAWANGAYKAIAELESQEPVAGFYLPIRKDMREDVEALIDHAKRARWTNVVVRKDAVETTYEADWIKELIPYIHPPQD
jgi:hypothetical protein